jgi:hypothetical protein
MSSCPRVLVLHSSTTTTPRIEQSSDAYRS